MMNASLSSPATMRQGMFIFSSLSGGFRHDEPLARKRRAPAASEPDAPGNLTRTDTEEALVSGEGDHRHRHGDGNRAPVVGRSREPIRRS